MPAPRPLLAAALAAAAAATAPAQHWAFAPPQRRVPALDSAWCRDDLDRVVLAGLQARGLRPAPPAPPATWLRRVHLVLTGLGPTPAEVAAFAADASDAARARVVDDLLQRAACAEHLAAPWLDLARFADTYGFQADFECRTWPWRDWLIDAFHRDLPWDRFTAEVVAGDLLLDASDRTRTATAFWRLHRMTNEGGSIDAEWRHEYIADRVDTFGTAFLGLTLGCARCHDHKTDPIQQRDYYALGSFFALDEAGLYPYSTGGVPQPALRLATPAQQAAIAARQAEVRAAEQALADLIHGNGPGDVRWPPRDGRPPLARWSLAGDGAQLADAMQPARTAAVPAEWSAFAADGRAGRQCDGDARLAVPGLPALPREAARSVRLVVWCPDRKDRAVLLHTSHYTQDADTQGYQLLLKDGRLCWEIVHHWPGSAAAIRSRDELPLGRWVDVVATYDGSSTAAGLALHLDGEPLATEVVRDHLQGPATVRQLELGGRDRDRGFAGGRIAEFALWDVALTGAEIALLAGRQPAPGGWQELGVAADAAVVAARRELQQARAALHAAVEASPELMVMAPNLHPEPRYVLRRGAYDQPDLRQPVARAVPGFLPPLRELPPGATVSRLHLAEWLADPAHPLAWRVAVDRLWAQCFGRGLVPTPENFGRSGTPPAQRELLDLLAVDFAREPSQKRLLRRIVLSATFAQDSAVPAAAREADPDNAWLARGPSFRLAAEVLRDQALFAAGLLHPAVGGPSRKPWQPPGLWRDAGVGWGGADYQPDQGPEAHRRSLYTYRKRTAPPPNLTALDAPSREVCVARRQTTDTPLQALVFLNDPVFGECAAALAARVLAAAPAAPVEAQLGELFVALAARPPRAAELAALRALHDRAAAAPLAALTLCASTLLASDAVVMLR